MKIKTDFVSNSSSTSFIITCEAEAGNKDDFIDKINGVLKDYINKRDWDEEFQKPPMLTSDRVASTGSGVFDIHDFVPIYCCEEDTPQYIQELFLNKDSDAHKALDSAGIKVIKIENKKS